MNNPFGNQRSKSTGVNRRQFLAAGMVATTGVVTVSAASVTRAISHLETRKPAEPWLTIAAVQQQLLPEDGNGPGAKTINALAYLLAVTEQPQFETEDNEFLFNGVGWLNDLAQQRHQSAFVSLEQTQQSQLIESIARSRAGENWLSLLMTYLIEALLTPPVYGGNPNGVGWRWLQHQPGFPLPPENKKWYLL